jgi:predicted O-methyltransferase YrrM
VQRLRTPVITRAVAELGDPRAVPDVRWLERLLEVDGRTVEGILREVAEFAGVERAIRSAHEDGGRTFYAQFRAPLELYALVRLLRPAHIVETGVSSGVSSAHLLLGLRRNGRGTLHSIDLPLPQRGEELGAGESPVSLPPGRASGWAIPPELRAGWDLRVGPSQALLPTLISELDSVDLFLHDSMHTPRHLTFELTTVQPKLHPGSVVLADNTNWTGQAFDRFAGNLGVPVARRAGSDLVGLRVPAAAGSGVSPSPGRLAPAASKRSGRARGSR